MQLTYLTALTNTSYIREALLLLLSIPLSVLVLIHRYTRQQAVGVNLFHEVVLLTLFILIRGACIAHAKKNECNGNHTHEAT